MATDGGQKQKLGRGLSEEVWSGQDRSVERGEEHRMKKEEMEGHFNNEAKQGWRFAADAPTITDENASSEDRRHTSGAVFVAVDSNLGAVIGKEEGAVESIPGNDGRIAQAWVNVRGGMQVFPVQTRHSEGWDPRNEALFVAVVKRAGATRYLWLISCDPNMSPEDFEKFCGSKAGRC